MSLSIINSNFISILSIGVTYDLSGVNPVIYLENLSQGDNLAGCTWWWVIKSPTTTIIHEGSESDPDQTGNWSNATVSDNWPRPFGSLEWSGSPYTFQAFVKDGDGNIFTGEIQQAFICRPNGNLPTSKNPYGVGAVTVQTKCDQARIYFQDVTNTSYKGIAGTVGSSVLRVNFPMDNTGTVPSPFQINYFSTAMVPITYSGKGYQFLYTSIWDYDLGQQSTVRIKYLLSDTFGVFCNIDLMPLVCEYQKLINSIETGSCNDVEAANRKLMLINPKMALVGIGMMQPLTGVDVPSLIQEIEEIGGFDCDCCNAPSGIVPPGSSAFDGYTFSVVPDCGDISGEFVANGYNIQLHLSDVTYVFKMCDASPQPTTAFEIRTSTEGCQKTYCLYVDVAQLAEDILTTISTNVGLVNFLNSLIAINGNNITLTVDGDCVIDTSVSCDYTFTMENIPVNTTYALLVRIASLEPNFAFNLTNLAALQTYLNTLGLGTFVVTNPSGQTVVITSTNNTNNINVVAYLLPGNVEGTMSSMTKDCTGFAQLSANQVVQAIINYLCGLDDSQVVTSAEYEICYIDGGGEKQIETISAGQSLSTFIAALTERGCATIDYIVALKAVNCANIKEQFPQVTTEVMQANDIVLATKNGSCAGVYPNELFLSLLTYGPYNSDVLAAFCNMVNLCSAGLTCSPYNVFFAAVESGSPTSDIVVTFENPSELVVTNTIRYARIDNTVSPVYTTITGITPGASPYTIPGIAEGQYRVCIRPVYADGRICPELCYDTLPCTGILAFNAVYTDPNIVVTANFDMAIEYARVNIYYPNGGTFSEIFALAEGTLVENITPPVNVYGSFFATISPVCNIGTGYIGAPSAPATFEIEEASP